MTRLGTNLAPRDDTYKIELPPSPEDVAPRGGLGTPDVAYKRGSAFAPEVVDLRPGSDVALETPGHDRKMAAVPVVPLIPARSSSLLNRGGVKMETPVSPPSTSHSGGSSLSMLLRDVPTTATSIAELEGEATDPGYEPAPLVISRCFVEALNERNWNHWCNAHFSANYRARHDNWKAELTWEDQHKLYMATSARFPNFHMEVLSESVDIDEVNGKATVYQFVRITGTPDSTARDGLGLAKWRRENGVWMCYHHAGFRSCGAVF